MPEGTPAGGAMPGPVPGKHGPGGGVSPVGDICPLKVYPPFDVNFPE